MNDGQLVLHVTYLSFFLPEDFDGDLADAFECLAKYHREKKEGQRIVTKSDWDSSLKNHENGHDVTASWGLSKYDKEKNRFIIIDS